MTRSPFNHQTGRRRSSAPARFAVGVALSIGVTLAVEQAALSRSSKFEHPPSVPKEGIKSDKAAELSKQTTGSGTMDSHRREGPPPQGAAGTGSANLHYVREDDAPFAPRNVAGEPGKPALLSISLSAARLSESSLITIKGLPDEVKLSAGFRFQEAWAVSLKDAPGLMLLPAASYEGTFTIEVSLLKKQESMSPEKQSTRVVIRELRGGAGGGMASGGMALGAGQTTAAEVATPPSSGAGSPTQPKIPATEEAAMMERANGLLQSGDVAAARLVYERLARRGSQQGALALARSYDPEGLRSLAAVGLKPDLAKAREWYKKAAEMGSREAVNRLAGIEAGIH